MIDNLFTTISCVYANILSANRIFLWQHLSHISTLVHENLFVISDFNACFGAHWKMGSPPPRRFCLEFIKAVDNCGLYCLDINGPLYTWTNNHCGRDRVDIHLDRVLSSSIQSWNIIECNALARYQSDHNPILLRYKL